MYTLDELIDQNKDIAELSAVLMVLVANPNLRNNRYVCDLVSRFYDKVWMHLMFEDKTLYSNLLQHADPEVVAKIEAFHDSAKQIKKEFGRHVKQWCHVDLSEDEAVQFSEKMQAVIGKIIDRVNVENEEIIPLVSQ